MAEEAIKDAGATFYSVRTLNKWFFWSVALLTVGYLWSVVADYSRDWKTSQRSFAELERRLAEKQGQKAFVSAGGGKLLGTYDKDGKYIAGSLELDIERLHAQVTADHERRPELVAEYEKRAFNFSVRNAEMKLAKAKFEAERFTYEELAHEHGEHDPFAPEGEKVKEAFKRFTDLKKTYADSDEISKQAEVDRDAAKSALDRFDALADDVSADLAAKTIEIERQIKRADSVDGERLFNKFRNSIFFNFMAPSETPKKIVVNEIYDDLNFLTIPKVDMCITCHLATDRNKDYPPGNSRVTYGGKGNEAVGDASLDSPAFRSHSRAELFCTSLSPHPQDRFGCSGCHAGGNQRLDFKTTWHTPTDRFEAEAWEKSDHGWHPVHEWDFPMFGSKFFDASCYRCHKQEVHITGATKWNRGRDLVAKLGCFGCHKMAPFENYRRVGPPLGHVVSKFADLDFMSKWVDNPTNFRPSTRMPMFFHRENRSTEPGRDQAEISAIVAFLYNLNTPVALKKYQGNGDAANGKRLFGELGGVGCMGCHNIDDYKSEKLDALRHGPDLSGIGSKVTPDWLFTWVIDPKSLWADTNMPNLRLTDQEASDLVAYLMTKKNAAFEREIFEKPADDTLYEKILSEKLGERMTAARATDEISKMSGLEKRRRAGEFLINHYGCFGCHDIPGYEDAKPIGTELNGWGSKHPDRLDFGLVEMDWKERGLFNRETWLQQKLSNTRFYDRGKDKAPFEKLKMPQFALLAGPDIEQVVDAEKKSEEAGKEFAPDLNSADREAVMTFVMSLLKDNAASSIQKQLSPAEAAVERGRKLVREKNCIGCHMIYGEGGEIRAIADVSAKEIAERDKKELEARGYYPPVLDGQGSRTQPQWLFSVLADPVQGAGRGAKDHLRPWLKARMPTFGFDQQQLNDLVAYFANEEVWHTSVDRDLWDRVATRFKSEFPGYDDKTMKTADAAKQQIYQSLVARLYRKQGGRFLHETDYPYLKPVEDLSAPDRVKAAALFEKLGCVQCHVPGGRVPKGKTEGDMAPDLTFSKQRLAPSWVKHWLEGPAFYQPGTRMPGFWNPENGVRPSNDPAIGDPDREMALLRDYLFSSSFASDYQDIVKRVIGN